VIMMPLGPQFMRIFHIRPDQFGLLVSAYTFSASIAGLISSFFVDRFDRRKVILFIFTGFILSTFLCALSASYEQLLITRFIAGSFGGIMGALTLSITGDLFPPERRGRATGIIMSSFSVASVVGVPLGLYFASLFNWRVPFFAVAFMGLVFIPYARNALPPVRDHLDRKGDSSGWEDFMSIMKSSDSWKAFSFVFFVMITGFSVIPYLSPYLVKNVGLTEDQLPLIYLTGGLFTFFTSRRIGHLSDKYGKNRVFIVIAAISVIPTLIITHLPVIPVYAVITVTTFFMIFMSGRVVPAMALITGSVRPAVRGRFMSINASVQHLSTSLASFTGGLIVTEGIDGRLMHYSYVGYLSVVTTVMAIILAYNIKQKG
jgi:predicted MFS family arabinose efflux permease